MDHYERCGRFNLYREIHDVGVSEQGLTTFTYLIIFDKNKITIV